MHSFVIPVKFSSNPKSRLSGVMTAPKRLAFMEHCLQNLIQKISTTYNNPDIHPIIKGTSNTSFDAKCHFSDLPLNESIKSITTSTFNKGHRIIILHADLPSITNQALADMKNLIIQDEVFIYPDQYQQGTNALIYSHGNFEHFVFGESSYSNFLTLADQLNLKINTVDEPAIAFDLDDEEDFKYLPQKIANKLLD